MAAGRDSTAARVLFLVLLALVCVIAVMAQCNPAGGS